MQIKNEIKYTIGEKLVHIVGGAATGLFILWMFMAALVEKVIGYSTLFATTILASAFYFVEKDVLISLFMVGIGIGSLGIMLHGKILLVIFIGLWLCTAWIILRLNKQGLWTQKRDSIIINEAKRPELYSRDDG